MKKRRNAPKIAPTSSDPVPIISPLLLLPAELRNQIYKYVLLSQHRPIELFKSPVLYSSWSHSTSAWFRMVKPSQLSANKSSPSASNPGSATLTSYTGLFGL
ncbi:uncharacterized protein J4E88_007991 [Alternaria novae-zelandiae]|uniref:uncharacterized protein n=1 Tax=Alternaria novae-zelandiae TaxID=430562 RepID=UPI0020C2E1FE|nr:uncharacterized protein J4E88_007991 [Alternaria novae-zelandiae]KAI4675087.1 hypothetical protein J4E88_007991 [Alternaria novae-zelandiae]